MASNVVVDLQEARNRHRRRSGVTSGEGGRAASRDRLGIARVANRSSVSFEPRAIVPVTRSVLAAAGATALLVALLWLGYAGVMAGSGSIEAVSSWLAARYDEGPVEVREVVVRSGDTLWSIARDHGPASADIRETVDRIRRINGMKDAMVYPGQVLKVPVHVAGEPD